MTRDSSPARVYSPGDLFYPYGVDSTGVIDTVDGHTIRYHYTHDDPPIYYTATVAELNHMSHA